MPRSLAKDLWYRYLRVLARCAFVSLFGFRVFGQRNIPARGPVLILANHQSHFDPVLVGMCSRRRMNYLARESLFTFAPLRWLITSLDAIPIDRDGLGMSGVKETLRRLKREEIVLMFPEGTRTPHGEVTRMKPGFAALARRCRAPLLPVGIDGAFHAWPRTRPLPQLGTICVVIGEPLPPETVATLDDRQLVEAVDQRVRTCHARARRQRIAMFSGGR